jgi:hypothetical protein
MSSDLEPKNVNFVQFDRRAMSSHRQLILKSQLGAAILDLFIEKMNTNNAIVCSYRVLEEITGYSRASIGRALKVLKDDNWVQSIKIGSAHAYIVNSAAFWTTYANGKQYSMFHATVIASAEEQKQSLDELKDIKLKKVPVLAMDEVAVLSGEDLPPPDQKDINLI